MSIVDKRREETYKDARACLDKYGKCAIIRPPGFGKTGILTKFLTEYGNVLYLYPAEVVRDAVLSFYYGENIPEDRKIDNVQFMTYAKLVLLKRWEMKAMGPFDLIITDECHKLGATETQRALDMLLVEQPQAKLLGATATPDRMDLVDEIGRYFEDRVTKEYTLHDAFQDKVLQKPYYIYCGYGMVEENEALVHRTVGREIELIDEESRVSIKEELNQRLIELANIYNMDRVIRRYCDKYAKSTNYMRFIVFFPTYESVHKRGDRVTKWFRKAYPDHRITTTIVTSETEEYRNNVGELTEFEARDHVIDLIFSCDMLNMGYHVDGLTGIVMYRGTKSGIIYGQQLGRVLSSGSKTAGLVFDVVDNIHQMSTYSVLGHESKFTTCAKTRKTVLEKKKEMADTYAKWKNGEIEVLDAETSEYFKEAENRGEELNWTKFDASELDSLKKRFEQEPERDGYFITREDLIAVGIQAKYRELIAKTVAEAKAMRARQAWARWVEQGGEPFDENGRIRTRSQILALVPPEHHPLPPYCYLKQVSVNAVLDEMNIKDEAPQTEAG